jgi:hypothetical protein
VIKAGHLIWKSRRKTSKAVNPDEISKVFDADGEPLKLALSPTRRLVPL